MVPQRFSSYSLQYWFAALATLVATCSGDGPLQTNPAEVDPILEPDFDQFWAIPLGRAGYPALNEGPQPGPNPFPGGGASGPSPASPGGAAFYPGPIPGSVQLGYFSGPPSYPPGNYGFNGNGVFGFSIPANALVQQQQSNNQQNSWGSGFWSRFNPVNRVGSFFNFSQRQPVHQYAFSASITNQNNRPPTQNNPTQQQPPSNNPAGSNPLYYSGYPQPSQNWYNGGGSYVPFGNPYFFSQNSQFSNNHNQQYQQQQNQQFQQQHQQFQQQSSDASNNADKNPSYNRPSIPVYNPPSSIPDNSEPQNNNTGNTDNSSSFSPTPPLRSGSSEGGRPGIWGENLRRNWLHVPWIGSLGNRDVSPRTDFPAAALFSLQG